MMRKLSLAALVLVLSTSVFAGAKSTASAQKSINLVNEDATKWSETFGNSFKGNRNFNFKCQNDKCTLTVAVKSLNGAWAKQLLKGRESVEYKNQDGSFAIQCNKNAKANKYICKINRSEPTVS